MACHHDDVMMIAILIPWMYQIMFKNTFPVLLIGITCTVTLSTINTVRFKPLILWVNAGYGTGVKIRTPQLRLRVINRALYFTYGKGTWGGGAYYLWGAGCMRGNTVPITHTMLVLMHEADAEGLFKHISTLQSIGIVSFLLQHLSYLTDVAIFTVKSLFPLLKDPLLTNKCNDTANFVTRLLPDYYYYKY